MQCVVFAGGLGTRIMPLTANIPKYLIDINGKPFAHYQLTWLANHGVNNVLLSIAHLGDMIKDYVRDGSAWGIKATYVDEGNNLLGTAGALRLALEEGKLQENFLSTNGDSFLPVDFSPIYDHFMKQCMAPAQMTIFKNEDKWDLSNVKLTESNTIFYDKYPVDRSDFNYIDYGIFALTRSVIQDRVPSKQKYCLSKLFNQMSKEKLLAGYEINQRFYEIGSFIGIEDLKGWLKQDNHEQMFGS